MTLLTQAQDCVITLRDELRSATAELARLLYLTEVSS